jgi:hypothetical protein
MIGAALPVDLGDFVRVESRDAPSIEAANIRPADRRPSKQGIR